MKKTILTTLYLLTLIILIGFMTLSTGATFSPRAVLKEIAARQDLGHGSYLLEIEAVSYQNGNEDLARIGVYLDQEDRQLVTFEEPERMQDDCYLVVGYNTWIFQQGMRRPLRISAQQKLFGEAGIAETVGLDYLNDYRIEEVLETPSEYELTLVALDKRTAYRRVTLWLSKQNRNITKSVLMAVNGQPLKELTFSNYRSVNGHELGEITIKNLLLEKSNYTTLKFLRVLKKKIPDAAFQPMMMGKVKQFIGDDSHSASDNKNKSGQE